MYTLRNRYRCLVCGRVFPEGQGIVLKIRDVTLTFHSKTCAVKFFKYYIDILDPQCADKSLRKAVEDFSKTLEQRVKKTFLEE